eukprot:CAMPEP_0197635806 /NCGR_PEP_ID=MMETSP1338-20131121/11516_1 /TAXON_ID=43686 ORGANISM="Pelagodinium beii, Strain RCC1491" /NCGR_SAMPLE_ID=MMETSP1338 /ASSEMBLY_ACC=CAM_ASM_000754 /LENGTH=123 /DNA_ID=CAMNT_0043207931 /DNA_START=59 /DNA_END=431 /DNA_ORIENTATION=-
MAFRCLALIVLLVGRPLAIRQENSKGSMAVQDSQVSEDQEVPEFKTKAELDEYYRRRAEMKGVKMPQASAPDKASCLGSRPVHKCSACEFPKLTAMQHTLADWPTTIANTAVQANAPEASTAA